MNDSSGPSPLPARPNFLVLLADEERYPPVYESPEIRAWRGRNLPAQELLRRHSAEFHRHYIGSTACCPSRATLFTGHYPSLHGVSQTVGVAKESFDSDMHWLDPATVPTMGDYFRAAGYRTHYRGKWHISNADIVTPGTHRSVPSYHPLTGVPDPELERLYAGADRLNAFGFGGWIGPDPIGKNPRNSASSAAVGLSGRDVVYGAEAADLIASLDQLRDRGENVQPWLIVASFLNPHDIVLYGDLTARLPVFKFETEPMPDVAPPPTRHEALHTKPGCQASYRDLYPVALQPISDEPFYRRLYYQLQKNADVQMQRVLEALIRSSFYDDTVVIFTSDHGDLLGSHGNLHQKWYCAYEEFLHVPLLIHNRLLFPAPIEVQRLTSHVDLLPTMLGLANLDMAELLRNLQDRFSEARPLVGRDLSPFLREPTSAAPADAPVYFMTDDDVTRGQHQVNAWGQPYPSVAQPNHIETVLVALYRDDNDEIWKLSRYFDDSRFWSEPGFRDVPAGSSGRGYGQHGGTPIKIRPAPDEYELYNLTADPTEARNLAFPAYATEETRGIQAWMLRLLEEQRRQKRLYPVRT
ncbi:sulfatase-like hydrolase/transferase [Cohnella sp. REN36]|uniref:sulfatase-like hydrolase/transferase n=1 Tax=Cohnella sp. REN36 TaxID=2887347 RepID=UPI001D14878E|nr:sulfatase-like hydrolase/transferase [Cohnella sp. REN36]MCC3374511.1 sulfatase-like hydrolase/transferase [Cohnella sp. REN36]